MSKMNNFLNNDGGDYASKDDEVIMGNYGCSSCELDVPFAKFSEKKGVLYWTCVDGHRTEVNVV